MKPIIESVEMKITPTMYISEVYAKTLRVEDEEMARKQITFMKESSALAPLDTETAIKSAELDVSMKKKIKGWELADSIVYATGLSKEAKTVTGDQHFKGLQDVVFIK